MFLSCHACNWSQDDYWDERYNPIRRDLTWEHDLLAKSLDGPFPDAERQEKGETWRETLAHELERSAAAIRGMRYRTRQEYHEQNPEGRCPNCGQQMLGED